MKCLECDCKTAKYEDPRVPPLDTKPCLCNECYASSLADLIEDATDNIQYWTSELLSLT